jgi:glutathione S-transferase
MLPADPQGRADVDRWLHWQSCHLMPAMGALKTSDEKDFATINPLLEVIDHHMQDKKFFCGDLTVVDFAIAAYTLTKLGRKMDYSDLPHAAAWRDRVSQLKGFVETQVKIPA